MKSVIIQQKIYEMRGQRVMLDSDLAELYGMETKVLKQAVRRNLQRFPEDFMFTLTRMEADSLRSQFVTLKNSKNDDLRSQIVTSSHGGARYLPFAFTEHGVAMLASVLGSEQAIEMNITIVRTFIALRKWVYDIKDLSQKISDLEKKYDRKFSDVVTVIDYLLKQKEKEIAQKTRTRIGYKK